MFKHWEEEEKGEKSGASVNPEEAYQKNDTMQ